MPIPTFTRNQWFFDFRVYFDQIFKRFVQNTQQGLPASTPTLTTRFGHRAILFQHSDGANNYDDYFIYAVLGSTQFATARQMLIKPGFDGSSVQDYGDGSTLLRPSFPTVINYWIATILAMKQDILTTWCAAIVTAPAPTSVTSGTNKIASALGLLIVKSKAEVMVSSESLYGLNFNDAAWSNGTPLQVPSVVVGTGNTSFSIPPQAFVDINENLQLIALRDYQISFNHSQTIFSAMGGIVTG